MYRMQSERYGNILGQFSFRHFTLINGLKRMTLKPDKRTCKWKLNPSVGR